MFTAFLALLALILAVMHFEFQAEPETDTGRRLVEIGRDIKEDFRCGLDWAFHTEEERDPVCVNRSR